MENENAKKMAAMLMSKLENLDLDKIKGINIGIMMSDSPSSDNDEGACDNDDESVEDTEENLDPHKMYDSDGNEHDADTLEDHKRMKKMGYTHKGDNDAK